MPTGKFKNHVVKAGTVNLSSAVQTESEIVVPQYGDIRAIQLVATVSATGTLSSPNTLDNAINTLVVKDVNGEQRLQNVLGTDLNFLESRRGLGRNRTVPTISNSNQTHAFTIPLNIEKRAQNIKVTVAFNTISDLATSGATAGTVEYAIVVYYDDATDMTVSEKIEKVTVGYNSGNNTIWTNLPKGVTVTNVYFKCTESEITSYKFTSDGEKEFDDMKLSYLTGLDEVNMVDGHVSGEFSLYVSPFVSSIKTEFNLQTNTSGSINMFLVEQFPVK